MKKHERRRFLAMLLAVVLTLGVLPVSAYAANGSLQVLNGQITVAYEGKNAKASVANDVVTAEAYATVNPSYYGDSYSADTTTLTITNASAAAATMVFDYAPNLSGGSMELDGKAVTGSGNFSKEIPAGGSVTVKITSPSDKKTPAVATLRNFALVSDSEFDVTIMAPAHGSVTVNGAPVTADTTVKATYAKGVAVTAAPAEGYDFVGWVDVNDAMVLKSASGTIQPTGNMVVRPWFVPAGTALFGVEDKIFNDLNQAAAAANSGSEKKIVLLNSGTVFAGTYTIPAGVTLLIPFDEAGTCYKETPEAVNAYASGQKVFRKLTLADGVKLTVDGELSVSAKHGTAAGSRPMGVTGTYGQIQLQPKAEIMVNDKASLYAWGYITGSGHVTAKAGATVYELFQLTDFRGGFASMLCLDTNKKHFVFSQYYVQNIESPITYETGANEIVVGSVTVGGRNLSLSPKFVGKGGLFEQNSGTLTKWYDPQLDQLQVAVDGSVSLSSIQVKFAGVNANSADYNLPINNVMLHIRSGEVINGQDVEFLPDSGIKVYPGATLNITKPSEIYLIDKADWGNFVWNNGDKKLAPLVYSPTRGANQRTGDTMESALLDVNGTVNVDGILKTSASGADVISTAGGGRVNFNSADQKSHVWHYNQTPKSWTEIPVVSAKLKNADGTFVDTANHTAGTKYQYQQDKWINPDTAVYTITWKNEDGTVLETDAKVPYGTTPTYDGAEPTKAADAQNTYTFAGWTPEVAPVTGDVTYTATYTAQPNVYTVTWVNWDDTVLEVDEGVPYGTVPTYDGAEPARAADAEFTYTFAGWDIKAETKALANLDPVTANITYKATYEAKRNTYTVTWLHEDGKTVLATTQVEYGTVPTYDGVPTKAPDAQYTYTFAGWTPEVVAVTGNASYTATFQKAVNAYTVTWKNWDGTVLETDADVPYGTTPTYDSAEPTRTGDAQYNYTFTGWDVEVAPVTGDVTYTAVFQENINTYTITWQDEDGTVLESTKVAYGEVPGFKGTQPSKAPNAQYTYTFAGWTPEVVAVTGEATYTATYTKTTNAYTVTWKNEDGTILETDENVLYGTMPSFDAAAPTKESDEPFFTYQFTGWDKKIAAVTGDVTYTATFEKVGCNGWLTDATGTTYLENGVQIYKNIWADIEANTYFFDANGYIVKGLYNTTAQDGSHSATFIFDAETGIFQREQSGLYDLGADTYWTKNGEIVEYAGLVKVGDVYYYFEADNKAVKSETAEPAPHYVEKTNGLALPQCMYSFDRSGVIVHDEDTTLQGIQKASDDQKLYLFVDGVKICWGLFELNGDYYYARTSNGAIVHDTTYWVSQTNGLPVEEASYRFDAAGKMILPDTSKNGIIAENGSLWYYVDGKLNYAGLIMIDGSYYYVRSNGEVVHDRAYWTTKTNGLLPETTYEFGPDGKMIVKEPEPVKNGIVAENGSLYYYENGVLAPAGLIKIGNDYYYARTSNAEIVQGRGYWVTKTNGLLKEGLYQFDSTGAMIH